jgi:hypothetical protein
MEWNIDRIIGVIGIGLGIVLAVAAIGVGLGMDTKTQGEFRFVQGCFVFSALVLLAPMVVWGVKSQTELLTRLISVAIISALIAIALIEGLRWAGNRHKEVEGRTVQSFPALPRAHLHITKFEWKIPADEGGHASVKVIFVNDGKVPTAKVTQASKITYFAPIGDLSAQRAFEKKLLSSEPSITNDLLDTSDNEIPVGVDRSFTTDSPPWTKTAIENFLRGDAVVYIAGTIFYSDERATHSTSYCGFVDKDGNMKFCSRNNQEP